jgi:hypothetical protein
MLALGRTPASITIFQRVIEIQHKGHIRPIRNHEGDNMAVASQLRPVLRAKGTVIVLHLCALFTAELNDGSLGKLTSRTEYLAIHLCRDVKSHAGTFMCCRLTKDMSP